MLKMTKIFFIFLGVLLVTLASGLPPGASQEEKPIFKFGVSNIPETVDPAQAWDSASIGIIDQVCEGLVAYDLFDPELTLIPRLATDLGTWNAEATEITFALRQNVTFHDGTPFNATAVKYSFDRLNNLILQEISQITELYEPLANFYPATPLLINETVVVSEFMVKFILNYPYVPFLSLLCFSGSYIVHPNMPFDRLIELDEPLFGTGPYKLANYTLEETHFIAYSGYYRPQPDIQEMLWIYYENSVILTQAFLAGDIDMPDVVLPDYIFEYCTQFNFHADPPKAGSCIYYMGMNNKIINQTFRQVISYSIDYNYIVTNIMNNQVVRMTSVVPAGMLYHDPTAIPAGYDLRRARQILVDHGLAGGLLPTSSDLAWYNLAETTPIATFQYEYNIGNRIRSDIGLLIQRNLKLAGINISITGITWQEYLQKTLCLCGAEPPQIFLIGKCPDYNDPSTYIIPLMSNNSLTNIAEINDPWLQNKITIVVSETDPTIRRTLYSEMQHYIVEELMPYAFLYTSLSMAAWNPHLENVPRNVMGKFYFYSCTWYPATSSATSNTTSATTSTTTMTSTSDTFPSNPLTFISGNVKFILLSFVCVPIALIYITRKKSYLNRA